MNQPRTVRARRSLDGEIWIDATDTWDEESARKNWGDEYIDELIAALGL